MIDFLISITRLDWKPFALALIGFLFGVVADKFGTQYGGFVGLAFVLLGWWFILGALMLAHRRDLPLWKIFYKDTQ
jgi:hypothetical protein